MSEARSVRDPALSDYLGGFAWTIIRFSVPAVRRSNKRGPICTAARAAEKVWVMAQSPSDVDARRRRLTHATCPDVSDGYACLVCDKGLCGAVEDKQR